MERLTRRKLRASSAVEIQEKRFGYFPKTFRWRGKQYAVQAVERCWHATRLAPQLCFRVRCHEGLFDLYQNIRDNTWQLVALNA